MCYNLGMHCNHRHKGFEFLKISIYIEAKILFYFFTKRNKLLSPYSRKSCMTKPWG